MTSIAYLCACAVLLVIAATMRYSPHPWADDSDCSRIVQHSVRVMSDAERYAMWHARYYLFLEHGDKFAPRLPLKPP